VVFINVWRDRFDRGCGLTVRLKENEGMNFIKFMLNQVEENEGDCTTS